MAARRVEHLLVGGGIASATAAATLRENGADGSIVIVGREVDAPYNRPPASKEYLRGERTREDTLIHAAQWWPDHDVELLTRTSVLELDLAARTAKLSSKEEVEFGSALIATGAMVRRLNVDGADLDGLHYLRTLGNADSIRGDVADAERVVLVGGSYIGCEVAASLTELGKRCTIVMQEAVTFEHAFGSAAGRFFQQVLSDHGVEVIGEDEVERFEGAAAAGGGDDALARVTQVVTKGGRRLPADAVVLGVGAMPDAALARKAGLELGPLGGVSADARLQTAAAGVYVAGDMCEYESTIHGRPMRIEHTEVAAAQGRTTALNMLGRDVAHEEVPYFYSDLSDWVSLEYVGPAQSWDDEVVRGSPDEGSFTHWYLERGRVVAALAVGRTADLDPARRLIASHADVSAQRDQLADPDSDLEAVGAGPQGQ